MRKILLILIGLSVSVLADFVRNSATGIVTDSATSLQWQDDAIGNQIRWQSAIDTCENLVLGGQSDWRLPNINELETLIDQSRVNPAIASVFTQANSSYYWSSTTFEFSKGNAWYVDFNGGRVNYYDKNYIYYVRCVRAGQ